MVLEDKYIGLALAVSSSLAIGKASLHNEDLTSKQLLTRSIRRKYGHYEKGPFSFASLLRVAHANKNRDYGEDVSLTDG